MQHLEEGTIHAWLDGALSANEAADVEQHVTQCGECAALVAEARGMIAGATRIVSSLDIVRGGVIPKSQRASGSSGSLWRTLRFTPARAALAATLLIAVSTMLTLRHDTADKVVPPAAKESPAVATIDTRATDRAATPPSVPAAAPAPSVASDVAGRPTRQLGAQRTAAKAAEAVAARREVADAMDAKTTKDDSSRSGLANKPSVAERAMQTASAVSNAAGAAPPATPPGVAGGRAAGPVPDSARLTSKTILDSLQGMNRVRAAAPGFAESRDRAAVARLDAMRATGFGIFSGCYQLTPDAALKSRLVPERFALVESDTVQNPVRSVMPDGHIGDLIAGASWARSPANVIEVRFRNGGSMQLLTIRLLADGTTGGGTLIADGLSTTLSVSHLACR